MSGGIQSNWPNPFRLGTTWNSNRNRNFITIGPKAPCQGTQLRSVQTLGPLQFRVSMMIPDILGSICYQFANAINIYIYIFIDFFLKFVLLFDIIYIIYI